LLDLEHIKTTIPLSLYNNCLSSATFRSLLELPMKDRKEQEPEKMRCDKCQLREESKARGKKQGSQGAEPGFFKGQFLGGAS
jgi:hypothetical protein